MGVDGDGARDGGGGGGGGEGELGGMRGAGWGMVGRRDGGRGL